MKLKIVSWNMAHWTNRTVAQQAWNYLNTEIAANILLVQESVPPMARQNESCAWREIGGTRRWGSAVLTNALPLTEVHLKKNDYPGALTVADVTLPDGSTLFAVSVYGQLDEKGYSITTLHRMLSDLTHLFEGELQKGGRPKIILGGDLNASLQCDAKQGNNSHRIFFQRLEDFGLVDCQGAFTNERPRTLRHTKSDFPWVNDYIFASENLAKKVVACEVVERPEMLNLSDHNPVVVTFEM
jgi:exonuclease III